MRKNRSRLSAVLALVLIVAMLASFAGCGKTDPKAAVKEAAIGTFAELGKVGAQFGYDKIAKLTVSGDCHQDMQFYLKEANVGMDLSPLYGTGLVMSADSNIADRKMAVDMSLSLGDYTALTMDLLYLDSGMYFGCKELLGDEIFGVNTETLAQDLPEAGLDESFNFNIFDIIDEYVDENGKFSLSVDTKKALADAYNTLADAADWSDGGKSTITAGSDSGECAHYTMTVPAGAACDFIMSVVKTLAKDDYLSLIMQSALAEELYAYDSYEQYIDEQLADMEAELRESLTQELTFDFYVKDKLLRCVMFSVAEGGDFTLAFGMGKNAADYIELSADVDGEGFRIVSQGSHVLADGKFTDKTVLTVSDGADSEAVSLTMDTDYDTKSGDYTSKLYAEAEGEAVTMDMAGNLKIDGESMDMSFDAITVDVIGMNITLAGSYHISKGESVDFDVSGARMIADMTDADIEELDGQVEQNVYALLINLVNAKPEIMALFG